MTRADVEHLSKAHGDVLTAISDGMVALLKEYYGVGPTQTKTYYHDDLVVCVLRGGFTRVEQTLRRRRPRPGGNRTADGLPGGHARNASKPSSNTPRVEP